MFVAEDPRVSLWPKDLVERGVLLVFSVSEVYGPERIVDAAAQRVTFEASLAEARSLGYTGLRVVADNTSLVSGPERLQSWLAWENEADRLMQTLPISGLCSFDRTRCDNESLQSVVSVHREGPPSLVDDSPRQIFGD